MNAYLVAILAILFGRYLLELIADVLNVHHLSETVLPEFEHHYDTAKYAQSQRYLRDNTRFGIAVDTVETLATVVFVLVGGFNVVDRIARSFGLGTILTGVVFAGILMAASGLLNLPFSVYDTFVLEEKYGFNRTTPRTFALDIVKTLLLAVVIGAPVFSLILWFFEKAGDFAWIYCWGATVFLQLILLFLAPYVIMPLFNKFIPLDEGVLRTAVERYAKSQSFKMKGVFKMDGSKRSSKTNAFFTGFGGSRRIVLFDTLIARHTVEELVAIIDDIVENAEDDFSIDELKAAFDIVVAREKKRRRTPYASISH